MRNFKRCVAVLLVFLAGGARAEDGGAAAVRGALEAAVKSGDLVGVQMAMGDGQKVDYMVVMGRTGPGGAAVDERTRFCIGSCSKPVSSAVVFSLVEAGKMSLDEPVAKVLPAFGNLKLADGTAARSPTVQELLCHRAGIFSQHEGLPPEQQSLIRDYRPTLERAVAGIAAQPLIAPPGTRFAYSGAGFCVLGRAAEVATGESFETLVQRQLAGPVGMARTTYFPLGDANVAAGVIREGGADIADPTTPHMLGKDLHMALIGGSLYSTAGDLGRFAMMVINRGSTGSGRVMTEATWQGYTGRVLADEQYGNGWGVQVDGAGKAAKLSHAGSLASSKAMLRVNLTDGRWGAVVYTLGPVKRGPTDKLVKETFDRAMTAGKRR